MTFSSPTDLINTPLQRGGRALIQGVLMSAAQAWRPNILIPPFTYHAPYDTKSSFSL